MLDLARLRLWPHRPFLARYSANFPRLCLRWSGMAVTGRSQAWRLVILPKWDGAAREVSRRYEIPPRSRREVGRAHLPNLSDSLLSLGKSAVLSHLSGFGRDQHPRGVPERSQSDRERHRSRTMDVQIPTPDKKKKAMIPIPIARTASARNARMV